MRILSSVFSSILSIALKLFWLFELFLFLRLSLKFLGANPQTPAVNLVYEHSDVVVSPFVFIFRDIYWRGHLVEMSVISAMVGYAIAAFVVFKILRLFFKN